MQAILVAFKELLHRKGSTVIAILLVTIGMATISILGNAALEMERRFNKNTRGIDMVVGAKGSPLQLVLSSVLHIDDPTGNIKLTEALRLKNNPMVQHAIPLAYGDNYMGYRVLGTNPEFVDFFDLSLANGTLPGGHFEAVVGYEVAKKTGLKVGEVFKTVHGSKEEGDIHEHPFKVTGLLNKTGLAIDNLLITDIQSVWDLHHDEHEHAHIHHHHHKHAHKAKEKAEEEHTHTHSHEHKHNHAHTEEENHAHEHNHKHEQDEGEEKEHHHHHAHEGFAWRNALTEGNTKFNLEITAMLIKFKGTQGLITIPRMINEQTRMQAALPGIELNRLYKLTGTGVAVMQALAALVFFTAGLSILLTLLSDVRNRYFEMALMRVYGAKPSFLAAVNIWQAIQLVGIGIVFGLVVAKLTPLLLAGFGANGSAVTSLLITKFTFFDLQLAVVLLIFSILAGLFPAIKAYRLNLLNTLKNA
ncbi:MAG: ABC transporter permease [Luteibaculaceae bacterium]